MRLFGLIGFPLSHSFSAKYFQKKFADENISDADYRLFSLPGISKLQELIEEYPDLQGFNITIPHKVAVLPELSDISQVATDVGAVNCVKIERESSGIRLYGFNTDVYGFRQSLIPLLKPYHYNALILGTGGAAKAVSYALLELGIGYTLVSRNRNKKSCYTYTSLTNEIINDNLLIINTTPVGIYPDTENYPDIPYNFLSQRHLVYDLIYNPSETMFLKKAKDAGATTKNGLQMLELQAEKSWEIWNTFQ